MVNVYFSMPQKHVCRHYSRGRHPGGCLGATLVRPIRRIATWRKTKRPSEDGGSICPWPEQQQQQPTTTNNNQQRRQQRQQQQRRQQQQPTTMTTTTTTTASSSSSSSLSSSLLLLFLTSIWRPTSTCCFKISPGQDESSIMHSGSMPKGRRATTSTF